MLLGCLSAGAEQEAARWSYSHGEALSKAGVGIFAAGGHSWRAEVSTEELTPDGEPSLALHIDHVPEGAKPWGKQVNFNWPQAVSVGERYRISFFIKASLQTEVPCVAARGTPPYSRLDKKSGWDAPVEPEWKKVSYEYVVSDASPAPQAMPRVLLGNFPAGETLWLGPVTLERLDTPQASLLSNKWLYKVEAGSLPVDRIPAETVHIALEGDIFDIAGLEGRYGGDASAVFYQEYEAPEDGTMTVGMGADWYFECFNNGQRVYSTMEQGNVSDHLEPNNHIFNVPIRKGHNLMAVRVRSGSGGWRFAAGRVPTLSGDPKLARLFKPEAGKAYRPVNESRFLEVKSGTALDLSGLDGLPRPAGILGRLTVRHDGKPVFEKEPDKPVRFFGFNWPPNGTAMWRDQVHEWDKEKMDRFAEAVERRGYNMIRIHIPEQFLTGWDVLQKARKRTLDDVAIPQNVTELEEVLDMGNLDRLDYLIAAFKKRGIYTTLDLAGRHMLTRSSASRHEESFKARLFTNPVYRNHWKLFAGYLMNHVNPYTQVAYKDETAIIFLSFINEQDLRIALGLDFLTDSFRDYLRRKYENSEALAAAWNTKIAFDTVGPIVEEDLRKPGRRAQDTGEFLIDTMSGMTKWFNKTLRETGYRGLATHWDMIIRTLELPARALLPVVAQHVYFAHPATLPAQGVIPKGKRPNSFAGNYPGDTMVDQSSSINSSYFRAGAAARFLDRPYFNTEYSHSAPNRFRHERGLYFSSYAALQDWDSITAHASTVKLSPDPFLKFDSGLDPISRVNELLAALIYLRRDVQTAPSSVALLVRNKNMFPGNFLSAIGDDYAKLAFVTRIGLLYPEVSPLEPVGVAAPTMEVDVEDFTHLKVSQWYVRADSSGSGRATKLFQKLRERGILSPDNPTDPDANHFVSETGEITLLGESETMNVVTPRLEGAIVKGDSPVRLGRFAIEHASRPASIAIAALDGKKPLPEANRLLLILSTNAFNTGQIFDSSEQRITFEVGNHPALIEAIQVRVTLDDGRSDLPEIYSLNFDGTRAERLNAVRNNGVLKLEIDTSRLKYGSCLFEIVYP